MLPNTLPKKLAAVTLPVAVIDPGESKLPPVMLPLALTLAALTTPAVIRFPPTTLPVTLTLVKVPTEVILACALAVTNCAVPAVLAKLTLPEMLAAVILVSCEPSPIK